MKFLTITIKVFTNIKYEMLKKLLTNKIYQSEELKQNSTKAQC